MADTIVGRYGAASAPILVLRERPARIARRSARDAALRILAARFPDASPGELHAAVPGDDATIGLYPFQRDAVERAHAILTRYGGVLIADSVGLGKTHVGAALARAAFARGGRVAIVGPAALRLHWRAVVGAEASWLSYARLSRSEPGSSGYDLVVFDEAHALRNPSTRRYRAAARLCAGARVVLLSATPVNNSITDLYHLLRLFAGDRHFAGVGVPSLRGAFEHAESTCLLGSTPSIQPVLRAVMIRRTREQVRSTVVTRDGSKSGSETAAREGQPRDAALAFPRQRAPCAVPYALADADAIDRLAEALFELSFPAHGDATGRAPAELMRLGLLKRLESSRHAFLRTIADYDALLGRCLEALGRGLIMRARDRDRPPADGRPYDDAQLCFDELLFRPVGSLTEARRYAAALERERAIVRRLHMCFGDTDAKLAALITLLDGELRGVKTIVFSQFRDTARYVQAALRVRYRCALIDGARALLGADSCDRAGVVRRFAPRSNGATEPAPRETIDVLVATDVLSEGFNLQDAAAVISYDLPWNPIRLVQRVGRIDRLGSPHATVASFHFLPGELERYLGLVERIARKTAAIEATTGSDVALPHTRAARALRRGDADVFDRIEREDAGALGIDERLRRLLASRSRPAHTDHDDIAVGVVVGIPSRCYAPDAPSGIVGAVVGARFEWVAVVDGVALDDDRHCAELLERAITAPQAKCRPIEPDSIEALLRAGRQALARRAAAGSGAALLPAGGAAAALGHRLLRAAADVPGGLDARLATRIEGALERLAGAPDAALDRLGAAGGREVAAPAGARLIGLLELVETLECGRHGAAIPTRDPAGEKAVRIVGVLVEAAPDR